MDQLLSSPGILMKPDLREDLDQRARLQDIIDILVAAGYFRARIKTLSPFDKIIGGMAWAIRVSCHDLDIDLFFQDSLDIGHKIALTEKIVRALLAMNCPYTIEPHQIQGLDCIHILPIIQWLVRISIETMQQHAAFNKLIAARKYELIDKTFIKFSDKCAVNTSKRDKENLDILAKLHLDETQQTIVDDLEKQIDQVRTAISRKKEIISVMRLRQEGKNTQELIEGYKEAIIDMKTKIKSLENVSIHLDDVSERKLLASKLLLVKKDKDTFKRDCRSEKESYQVEIERLQAIKQNLIESEGAIEKDDLRLALNEKTKELEDLNIQLLATNQKIINLRKKLDSVPSKSEVSQYQKRFVELYYSIASRSNDIKKMYIFYNTLQDTRLYMKKEINLLDSIYDNLATAMHSSVSKSDFFIQFQQIVDSIIKARINVYENLETEKNKRNKLNDDYTKLIDKRRLYTKLLRELKEECHLNEMLSA